MLPLSQLLSQIPILSSLLTPQTPFQHTNNNIPVTNVHHACPNPPSLSCPTSPPADSINTCCVNHPSGHFLQTQFWDTSPSLGPNTSWTIHGLWPDLCSGGFDQFCDAARSHSDIRGVLSRALNDSASDAQSVHELLDFMSTYWLAYDGNDENFWSHEWNKHGTCISTLEPSCYPERDSSTVMRHHHLDVLDYFVHTTSLYRTLDTFSILAEAGILPAHDKRYTLTELEGAVSSSKHGQPVTFRCNHRGELNEVWFHFSVMGSLRNSTPSHSASSTINNSDTSIFLNATTVRKHFIPAPPDGILSNCPRQGIKYLPKHSPSDPPAHSPTRTHSSTAPSSTSTSAPFTGKGDLEIHVLSDQSPSERKGCLIRHGEWYASGSCATFRSKRDVVDPGHAPLFSLSSSYSPCLVNPTTAKFECTKAASVQGIFSSSVEDEHVLAYRNQSIFYTDKIPGRFEKVDLYANDGDGQRDIQVEIHWVAV
ncbi:Ribonuclease T2 precursor (RNase T2) [Cladophialophora chaetospira]|uniref:Ribonuclease T2-like n=1 Tax=Cladophialophora chaetospira TaxID=386627 RepID=A0AA38WYN7_9EURO|nr:Ribonuclease T2 precursor (RNase T2) [Cladophialophora chaetospira]